MSPHYEPRAEQERPLEADATDSPAARHKTRSTTWAGSVMTSTAWLAYFRRNRWDPATIVEHEDVELSRRARAAITRSIQAFQLGESGEGHHFLKVARAWAERTGDDAYVEALRLFIAEEQNHSEALGRFMDRAGIPRIRRDATDGAFRWLRHRAGLQLIITVLLTAEVIARVYYPALRRATTSHWLRRICERISRDEVAHIRFQGQRIGMILRRRSRFHRFLSGLFSQLLFDVTTVVVWLTHYRVFRAAGLTWRDYQGRCAAEFAAMKRQINIGLSADVAAPDVRNEHSSNQPCYAVP